MRTWARRFFKGDHHDVLASEVVVNHPDHQPKPMGIKQVQEALGIADEEDELSSDA